jgi:hypothetical protein
MNVARISISRYQSDLVELHSLFLASHSFLIPNHNPIPLVTLLSSFQPVNVDSGASEVNMIFPLFLSCLFFAITALATYAPLPAKCPSGSLVRPASGLSPSEENYRVSRKAKADVALKAWLQKTNPAFGTDGNLPTVRISRD